jgi:hypothetical protein
LLTFLRGFRPKNAGEYCEILPAAVIRPRFEGFKVMTRSPGAAGFETRSVPAASTRLTHAVAASLAIGSLSLCLIVALSVLSIKASMAMPLLPIPT